ncbi:hypothetical protein BX666DRAFT_1877719 [Dichotomocladium elegans]|nr:hypothetical protein BX666DRAFT_1877719 [Dichotomocladium elegans]
MCPSLTSLACSSSGCRRQLSIELSSEFGWSVRGEPVYGPGSVFQGLVKLMSEAPFQADHIPTVQYPPSIDDHPYYNCIFRLSAVVELRGKAILSTEKRIQYRPFIETSLLKRSISLTPQFSINSLDYLPGETISLIPTNTSAAPSDDDDSHSVSSPSTQQPSSITARLVQRSYLHAVEDAPELVTVIATETWKGGKDPVCIEIPSTLVPSLSYSAILAVNYSLQIIVKHKKKLWATSRVMHEYPIRIGTLGYGVRVPDELKIYSTMTDEEAQRTLPRFMQVIEYENSLPAYDHTRLPAYQVVFGD